MNEIRHLALALVYLAGLAVPTGCGVAQAAEKIITTISLTDPNTSERITPSVLGVNPTTNTVYVGGFTSPTNQAVLAVINGATITNTIPLTDPNTSERITPSVLGVNPTTNTVYVGGFTSPTNQAVLAVINGATITNTIPLTDPNTSERITPSVLGVNPTTNTVYVGGFTSPTNQAVLAVINGATITNTIPLTDPNTSERITPSVLGVNSTTNTVYVGGFTSPTNQAVLAVINGASITNTIPLTDPNTSERITPSVLGVNSTTNTVYVGGFTSPTNQAILAVINGASITNTIPLTDPNTSERITPSVLGVNPTTNTVYVGGFTSPTNQAVLAVINGATITNTIPLTDPNTSERITPSVLGVNSTTNKVYVGGFTSPTNQAVLAVIEADKIKNTKKVKTKN